MLKEKIFLIDGLGALLSCATYLWVLPNFDIGLPAGVLVGLGCVAAFFATYSLACHATQKKDPAWIKAIAFLNLLFCLLSAVLLVVYFSELTKMGVIFLIVEIIVILALVRFELRIANHFANQMGDRSSPR